MSAAPKPVDQGKVAAFAEILLGMDYFIEVYDEIPDTWPRGYEDDLKRINEVWRDNRVEIEAYRGRRGGGGRS